MSTLMDFFMKANTQLSKNNLLKKMNKKQIDKSVFALSYCYRNGTEIGKLIYDQNKGGKQRIGFIEIGEGIKQKDYQKNCLFIFVKDIKRIMKKDNLLTIESQPNKSYVFAFYDNGKDKQSDLIHDWYVFILEKMFQISEKRRSRLESKIIKLQKGNQLPTEEYLEKKQEVNEENKLQRLKNLVDELKHSKINDLSRIGLNMENELKRSSKDLNLKLFVEEEKKEEESLNPKGKNSSFVQVYGGEANLSKERQAFSVYKGDGQPSRILPDDI